MKGRDVIYKPVTILSENELGQIGSEDWTALTIGMIKARITELEARDWEVIAIQTGEALGDLPYELWGT